MTTADIDAGRIIVRPSFADLFVCRQIPGSRWDAARKAWSLPATVATATLLRKKLRSVSESDRFKLLLTTSITIKLDGEQTTALLAGAVVPGNVVPLVPPVPDALPVPAPDVMPISVPQEPEIVVELPAGLRTKPWRHQRIAYKFCLDHFAQGLHGILLAMGMGTGKSLVACLLLLGLAAKRVLISCPLARGSGVAHAVRTPRRHRHGGGRARRGHRQRRRRRWNWPRRSCDSPRRAASRSWR